MNVIKCVLFVEKASGITFFGARRLNGITVSREIMTSDVIVTSRDIMTSHVIMTSHILKRLVKTRRQVKHAVT